jgi:hypothetical protein
VSSQRGVFDFLRSRGEEFLTQVSNELLANPRFLKAMQAAMRGKEWVDEAVAQALRTMNVPTRTEFKRAVARVDALEREVADARREAAAAAAAAARAARAPAGKTAAGKTGGRTAARKTASRKKTAARARASAKASSAPKTPPSAE